MNKDSPAKALLVVLSVALVCSLLVSITVVTLRPVQYRNQLIEQSRKIMDLTGLIEPGEILSEAAMKEAVGQLDMRLLDIDQGKFSSVMDPADFDPRAARSDPELSVAIPDSDDLAGLGRRESFAVIYLIWQGANVDRIILPVYGQGMWSTLYGYIALEADLNTIAAMTFYEQAETAGLGDQVQSREWLGKWRGRKIYSDAGSVRFRVASSVVAPDSPEASYEVDVMTGATITGDAVTRLIRYWFGPQGYAPFIESLKARPPSRDTLEDNPQ